MHSHFDISGRTAFITGASSGIGNHFARLLPKFGANVVLTARRRDRLLSTAEKIRSEGGKAHWISLDVTNAGSVQSAFSEAVSEFGQIDIVVNNAGIAHSSPALEMSENSWDEVMDTNLKGAWLVARQAGRTMSINGSGGSIINICSILGKRVMGNVAHYAAAKAALEHLTRVLAYEWARYGIKVNAIAPGYIITDINRTYLESPSGRKALKKIPQRRFGDVSDLDGALLLLASDASSYMTGSTIVVDGGHLQSSM